MAMDQYLYIPFLGGWTSINPSYFDVNYRGIGFWPIPSSFFSPNVRHPSLRWSTGHGACLGRGESHHQEPLPRGRRRGCGDHSTPAALQEAAAGGDAAGGRMGR